MSRIASYIYLSLLMLLFIMLISQAGRVFNDLDSFEGYRSSIFLNGLSYGLSGFLIA